MRQLLILFAFCASCELAPPVEPATGAAEAVAVAPDGSGLRYMYFSAEGRPVVVGTLAVVPGHLRELVAVLPPNVVPPDDRAYPLTEGGGQARLVSRRPLEVSSIASWAAVDHALSAQNSAVIIATSSTRPRIARTKHVELTPLTKPATLAPDETKVAPAAPTIEIVGILDDVPDDVMPQRARWKDVTLYYTDSCGVCVAAIKWMKKNDVPYRGYNVGTDSAAYRDMSAAIKRENGRLAVPTILVGAPPKMMQGWSARRFQTLARR